MRWGARVFEVLLADGYADRPDSRSGVVTQMSESAELDFPGGIQRCD
jgi:hypothetical protein